MKTGDNKIHILGCILIIMGGLLCYFSWINSHKQAITEKSMDALEFEAFPPVFQNVSSLNLFTARSIAYVQFQSTFHANLDESLFLMFRCLEEPELICDMAAYTRKENGQFYRVYVHPGVPGRIYSEASNEGVMIKYDDQDRNSIIIKTITNVELSD